MHLIRDLLPGREERFNTVWLGTVNRINKIVMCLFPLRLLKSVTF